MEPTRDLTGQMTSKSNLILEPTPILVDDIDSFQYDVYDANPEVTAILAMDVQYDDGHDAFHFDNGDNHHTQVDVERVERVLLGVVGIVVCTCSVVTIMMMMINWRKRKKEESRIRTESESSTVNIESTDDSVPNQHPVLHEVVRSNSSASASSVSSLSRLDVEDAMDTERMSPRLTPPITPCYDANGGDIIILDLYTTEMEKRTEQRLAPIEEEEDEERIEEQLDPIEEQDDEERTEEQLQEIDPLEEVVLEILRIAADGDDVILDIFDAENKERIYVDIDQTGDDVSTTKVDGNSSDSSTDHIYKE